MYKRYYDGYSGRNVSRNDGEIVVPENISTAPETNSLPLLEQDVCNDISVTSSCDKKNFLNLPCDIDDLILIGILIFVLMGNSKGDDDGGNDILSLIILGIILFSDIL